MHDELRLATSDLARFLQNELPGLSQDWWQRHVIDKLSFQQQRIATERRQSSLQQFDLAALLRIFDQNWFELSERLALPREARNWIKELQTVRNKWAHQSAEVPPPSEAYRDADTLERLLNLIEADQQTIKAVEHLKNDALVCMTGAQAQPLPPEQRETGDQAEELPRSSVQPHSFNAGCPSSEHLAQLAA